MSNILIVPPFLMASIFFSTFFLHLELRTYQATLHYLPATDDEPSRDEEMIPLPPLNKPLPSEKWVTMKGKFTSIYSSTIPFIATDFCFAPESKLDDGIIWLMIIRGVSLLLSLLLSILDFYLTGRFFYLTSITFSNQMHES